MNTKKAINSKLSTTKSKKQNKLSKQPEQEQNHKYGDHMEGYQLGKRRENEGKGVGVKKHNWQIQSRQRDVKNSLGNGEVKELIFMTYGH